MNILLSTCNVAGKNGIIRMEDISEVYLKPVPRENNQTTLYIVTKTGQTKSIFNGANEDAQERYEKLVLAMGQIVDLETMEIPEIEAIISMSEDVIGVPMTVEAFNTETVAEKIEEKVEENKVVEETPAINPKTRKK